MLIWGVGFAILFGVVFGLILIPALGAGDPTTLGMLGGLSFGLTFLLVLLSMVAGMLAQAGFFNAALKAHDTGSVEIGDFFKFRNITQVLLLGVVLGVINGILSFTFILPLVVSALTLYSMVLVVDRNMGFWDAIMGSAKLFVNKLSDSAILFVLVMVMMAVGGAICGLGILVAAPVAALAIVSYYRTLGAIPGEFKVG